MDAKLLDPRELNHVGQASDYVAIFWARETAPPGATAGFSSEEWLLKGAEDLTQVLDWIEAHKKLRDVELFAIVPPANSNAQSVCIRLMGSDPTIDRYAHPGDR